jgi:sulfur-oxidizing protein SoxB
MDLDLKLASRLRGIDAILGGHTHDGLPAPTIVANGGGHTLVTNAGSNGKFLAVLDLDVKDGKVATYRYKLLPVFSNLLPADAAMATLIDKVRSPYKAKLEETLASPRASSIAAVTSTAPSTSCCSTARGGEEREIAFSPGFRWGTALLPGQAITVEHLMDQTAITYPYVTVNELTGRDHQDDPRRRRRQPVQSGSYYQQGGDMVRVGGLRYAIDPRATIGSRIRG